MLNIKISLFIENKREYLRLDALSGSWTEEVKNKLTQMGAQDSNDCSYWLIPQQKKTLNLLLSQLRGLAFLDYKALKKVGRPVKKSSQIRFQKVRQDFNQKQNITPQGAALLNQFERILIDEKMSENTIKTYKWMVHKFLACTTEVKPHQVSSKELHQFFQNYLIRGGYSSSFQNQAVNAIKKFYFHCFNRNLEVDEIKRPPKEKQLPEILTPKEVKKLLDQIQNVKHKAAISTIYACGLRVGEFCNLKRSDLHPNRRLISIISPIKSDSRMIPYPIELQKLLQNYISIYEPEIYLFEGYKNKAYTNSVVSKIFKKALQESGIKKKVNLHSLRHSFAVHLLEKGTDIKLVQKILGHRNLKTTSVYIELINSQVKNIKSPFDDL